ncbi:MAG: HAMP domain-containing protein [Acidobacteria bacterium]|nr:HAMP domain-containing protein [Acidobacteriota bacterium]
MLSLRQLHDSCGRFCTRRCRRPAAPPISRAHGCYSSRHISMLKVWDLWDQPLRRQLFTAILLLLAPMLAMAVWLGLVTYREHVQELAGEASLAASRTAAAVERELTGLDRLARNVTINPTFQRLDSEAVAPLLRSPIFERPFLVNLVLIDRKGRAVARGASAPDISSGWTELAAPVFDAGEPVASVTPVSSSGRRYITAAYPVRDASKTVVGVLICYVDPQLMEDALGITVLPAGSVVMLSGADRRILAHRPDPTQHVGRLIETSWDGAHARAPELRNGLDGVRQMYGEAIITRGPWLVTVGIPTSVALDRAMPLWTSTFTILAFGLAGWLLVALVFSRRLTQSVGHLDTAAQRIASGDFSPIALEPMPTREFAQLQIAFDQMLRRFNDTRAVLDGQMAEERRMLEEVQLLQRQVIRQERLAAVGQLVSGVAHEINNHLQAILGFAELLQMQPDIPEDAKQDLVLIQKESTRACGIIRNLVLFARQQTGDAAPVWLSDLIASVAELR